MSQFSELDWGCVILQIVMLVSMAWRELRKPQGKNLIMILAVGTSLGLIQTQIVWMFCKFDSTPSRLTHLLQSISLEGARSANYLTTFFVICFCAVAYRMDRAHPVVHNRVPATGLEETPLTYGVTTVWILGAGAALTALAGGIAAAISNPGQMIAGQTLFLILVSLGKIPLARKLAFNRKVMATDIAIYGATLLLLLINSRFLASYSVLQMAIVFHYRRKEASAGMIVGLTCILMAIFLVFGLYRDAAGRRTYTAGFSTATFISGNLTTGAGFDWFYASNVEGFAGLAGIMTYESDEGGIAHDYGYSNLSLFTQLIPNSAREDPSLPFKSWSESWAEAYPYHGSIVAPGLEAGYAHFGELGVIGMGLLLGFLVVKTHQVLAEAGESSVTASFLSVHLLSTLRETIAIGGFFVLGELFILFAYRKILEFTPKPHSVNLRPSLADT